MNVAEIYLDVTPVRDPQLEVVDGDGVALAPRTGIVPLGGGLDLVLLTWSERRGGLLVSLDAAQTTPAYDVGIEWMPTLWSLELDAGARVGAVRTGRFGLDLEAGGGFRHAFLVQPWWDDYHYAGIGGHVGVSAWWGGPVRGLLGVRGSMAFVPGGAQGVLDSAAQDMTWTWTASGWRIGVRVGVGFGG